MRIITTGVILSAVVNVMPAFAGNGSDIRENAAAIAALSASTTEVDRLIVEDYRAGDNELTESVAALTTVVEGNTILLMDTRTHLSSEATRLTTVSNNLDALTTAGEAALLGLQAADTANAQVIQGEARRVAAALGMINANRNVISANSTKITQTAAAQQSIGTDFRALSVDLSGQVLTATTTAGLAMDAADAAAGLANSVGTIANSAHSTAITTQENLASAEVAYEAADEVLRLAIASNNSDIISSAAALRGQAEENREEAAAMVEALGEMAYDAWEQTQADLEDLGEMAEEAWRQTQDDLEATDERVTANTEVGARNSARTLSNRDNIGQNRQMIESNVSAIQNNSRGIANNSKRITAESAKTAASINALASAPLNGIGVAIGLSGSERALSVGYRAKINDRTTFTSSVAIASGQKPTFGIGIGFSF